MFPAFFVVETVVRYKKIGDTANRDTSEIIIKLLGFLFQKLKALSFNYPKNPSRIPAATAEPITHATLGPMACISKWLLESYS